MAQTGEIIGIAAGGAYGANLAAKYARRRWIAEEQRIFKGLPSYWRAGYLTGKYSPVPGFFGLYGLPGRIGAISGVSGRIINKALGRRTPLYKRFINQPFRTAYEYYMFRRPGVIGRFASKAAKYHPWASVLGAPQTFGWAGLGGTLERFSRYLTRKL